MRKLCVSPAQIIDELGSSGEYSSMAVYVDRLGDTATRNRVINRVIGSAQSKVETRLQTYLFQTRIVTSPVTVGKVRGTDYDVEESAYPYSRADFTVYATIYLRRRPVWNVHRAGLRYGNSTEQLTAAEWPRGWINQQARLGVLHILPILGMGGQISTGSAMLLPIVSGIMPGSISIPLIFSVDYTAGFLPLDYDPDGDFDPAQACPDFDPTPAVDAVRYLATASLLGILGRTIAPGGGGIGMDGFSQSWQGARFQPEIEDYKARYEEEITLMDSYFPLPVVAI